MPELTFTHGSASYRIETFSAQDHIHRKIAGAGGFYELPVLQWIQNRRRIGCYVDVGANIGNHSIWFLNECASSRLVAIEGNPAVTPLLRRNLERNPRPEKGVEIVECLVSCHPQVAFLPWSEENIGMSSVRVPDANAVDGDLHSTRPLDAILGDAADVAFIKIDVEGHELEVLESADRVLSRCKPDLMIECWVTAPRVRHSLRAYGYARTYEDYEGNCGFIYVGRVLSIIDRLIANLPTFLRRRLSPFWLRWLTACASSATK